MFTTVVIFVLLLSAVVGILVYLHGRITKKKSAQMRYVIAVDNSLWVRLSTFNKTIISMAF